MKRKFLTFVSLLCLAVLSAFAQGGPSERFYLEVSGYDGPNKTTVKATAYNNWNFDILLPAKESYIGAGQIDVYARITDVPDLDVHGTKEYSHTFTSGIETRLQLEGYFGALYGFSNSTMPVSVVDAEGIDVAEYNISMTGNTISGVTTKANADACWERVKKHGHKANDAETYGFLKSGAWLEFGNERLDVVSDLTLLNGKWSIHSEYDKIKAATTLSSRTFTSTGTDEQDKESYIAKAFVPKGSSLTFKGHSIVLDDDCWITVDASQAYDTYGSPIEGWMKALRDAAGKEEKVKALFKRINDVFGIINEITVPVEFRFADPVDAVIDVYYTKYPGSVVNLPNKTPYEFNNILAEYPNAVGLVTSDYASLSSEVEKNLVVEYPVGHNLYYECENFVLTDKVDFYTPVDFTAVAGNYTREPNTVSVAGAFYNSVCLPFAFSGTDFSTTAQALTFSFYEEKNGDRNVYFNKKSDIPAGNPCVVYDEGNSWDVIDFDNTPIVRTPDNSGNMQGVFVMTDEYAGTHYSVNVQNKFAKLADTLTAFRSCLSLDPGVKIPEEDLAKVNIIIIDETAGIQTAETKVDNSDVFYNLQGMRMLDTVKGGIYVKNGKKVIVK